MVTPAQLTPNTTKRPASVRKTSARFWPARSTKNPIKRRFLASSTTSAVRLPSVRLTVVSVPLKVRPARPTARSSVRSPATGSPPMAPVPSAATWVRATVRLRVVTAALGAMVAATRPAATVEATAAPSPVAATTAPVAAVEEVAAAVAATLPTAMAMAMAIAAAMVTVLVPTAALVAMAATAPAGRPERAEARFLRQDHQGIRRRHCQGAKGLPGTARQVRKRPRFQVRYSPGHRRRLLPCWDFTALGQRFDVCLTEYAKELSVIRYVVLFIAAMLAGWIVFYRT